MRDKRTPKDVCREATLDHVGCRLIFLSVVSYISLPFVSCRLTPFRPSLSLFYGLPRLISKCEVNESLFFQIIAFSGEGKQVKHCDIAFLDWEL